MKALDLASLKTRLHDTAQARDNSHFFDLIDTLFGLFPSRLCRVLVDLTAVAQTTLYTVPDGYKLYVDDIQLEGGTTQSGGTSSKLLIGTTTGSYAELLNGSTGHTFVAATATTLLPAAKRSKAWDIYEQTNMNDGITRSFTGGTVLKADVSGTVLTAGTVYVELYGRLVPNEA